MAGERWIDKQARKREVREASAEARRGRTPTQQLIVLDRRLGKGKGAIRERARLARQIEEARNV